MPVGNSISFTQSSGCDAQGGFLTLQSIVDPNNGGPYLWTITGAKGSSQSHSVTQGTLPYTVHALADDTFTSALQDSGTGVSAASKSAVISCTTTAPAGTTCDLTIDPITFSPLLFGPPGASYLIAVAHFGWHTSAGDGAAQVTLNDVPLADATWYAPALSPLGFDVALGVTWTVYIRDRNGCQQQRTFTVPRYGCLDPDADNYDPLADTDGGNCVYTPRLALADSLPTLAPLGVPFFVSLNSQPSPTAATAAPAMALLDLTALASTAGVLLRVDGYLFTSGPLIVPGRFLDASSLLDALQAQPALAASYTFTQPSATTVLVTAKVDGIPGTPTLTSSDAVRCVVTLTAGVAALQSQRRYRWGCYLEIWAGCGAVFGGATDKTTAVLAQRLTSDYRLDNGYQFDLASALRGFTGHAYPQQGDGSCPDRLISYFLRFGEEYADTATGLRRVRSVYESDVAWGLEAMEVPAMTASGLRLLTARPSPWRVQPGQLVPACVLAEVDAARRVLLSSRLATARALTTAVLPHLTATGQVTQALNRLPGTAGLLSGTLIDSDQLGTVGAVLATLDFSAKGQALSFVNRQGGLDTVYFNGSQDESTKRTPANFTNTAGPQLLSAETLLTTKLYSGLLPFPEWDWLRRELSVAPSAWLETDAGPVAVLLTDLTTEADAVKNEYSLSVDYQPAPVRGLSN